MELNQKKDPMKQRYRVTEQGAGGRTYWINLGDRAYLQCFGRELLLEREHPQETYSANLAMRTIFPLASFFQASVQEIADFVSLMSQEIRPPGLDVVLIPRSLGARKVEQLSLRNVSVTTILKYVSELTSTTVSYEDDAIVIRDGVD